MFSHPHGPSPHKGSWLGKRSVGSISAPMTPMFGWCVTWTATHGSPAPSPETPHAPLHYRVTVYISFPSLL